MKWLGVFLLLPWWVASTSQGYPWALLSQVPIYTPGWREVLSVRVKCIAQEHNTMSPVRAQARIARSGVKRPNHEASVPPTLPWAGGRAFYFPLLLPSPHSQSLGKFTLEVHQYGGSIKTHRLKAWRSIFFINLQTQFLNFIHWMVFKLFFIVWQCKPRIGKQMQLPLFF